MTPPAGVSSVESATAESTAGGTVMPGSSRKKTGSPDSPAPPPPPYGAPHSRLASEEMPFLSPSAHPGDLGMLGEYRILKVLGRGAMGVVFLGEDPRLERQVAIKVMRPQVAQDPTAKHRFLREAKLVAKLDHDHIVPIHRVDEVNGMPYIVMPVLNGMSLQDYLTGKRKLSLLQILRVGREIAQGLAAAHAKGLIHRDIKPANLWLDANMEDRIKILDWGLARPAIDETRLTQSNALVGTPAYMAPEQAAGDEATVDARADLYALGAVLYELITGRIPFPRKSIMSMLAALATEIPKEPIALKGDTPKALSDLVMKLLAKKPEQRPSDAQAVASALQKIEQQLAQEKSPDAKRRRRLLSAVALVVIACSLTAGGWFGWQEYMKDAIASPIKTDQKDPPRNDPKEVSAAAVKDIRQLLEQDRLEEAAKRIDEKVEFLAPADLGEVRDALKQKQEVRELITSVRGWINESKHKEALNALDAALQAAKPRFDLVADRTERDSLLKSARQGEHARLLEAAKSAVTAKDRARLAEAKKELKSFRDKHPHPTGQWTPGLETLRIVTDVNAVIERAWTAFLDNRISDCKKEIDNPDKDVLADPFGNASIRILKALVEADQAVGEPRRTASVTGLIATINGEKNRASELAPKLWQALEKAERQKSLFSFESTAALVEAVPAPGPEAVLRSRVVAHVLCRLVNPKACWRPSDNQWSKCRELCEMIGAQDETDWTRALHVECAVESQAPTPMADLRQLENSEIWYAGYASALARRKGDPRLAADLLAKALKNDQKVISPQQRSQKAVVMLREAVTSLDREGEHKKEFKNAVDAKKATRWLTPIVALETNNQKLLDGFTDLALAAGAVRDGDALKSAEAQASKLLSEGSLGVVEKERGSYWLARSYRACDPAGKYAEKVFQYCDAVLSVNQSGKSEWRRLAAQEGTDYALELGKEYVEIANTLQSAIMISKKAKDFATKLRPFAFDVAADRNRDAFALLLNATREKFPGDDFKEVGEVFSGELRDKLEEFHVPIVSHKLRYLRGNSYFDRKNEYLEKSMPNPYFEETIVEARNAVKFKQAPPAVSPDAEWWQKTQRDLLDSMFDCLMEYGDRGFKVVNDEKGDWEKRHIPKLNRVLGHYLEAKELKPTLPTDTKGHLSKQIGYTYVNLGHSYRATDSAKAIQSYEKGREELRRIPSLYRQNMSEKERKELRGIEDQLEDVLKKAKG
jgi:serine/threonine protein kinase